MDYRGQFFKSHLGGLKGSSSRSKLLVHCTVDLANTRGVARGAVVASGANLKTVGN